MGIVKDNLFFLVGIDKKETEMCLVTQEADSVLLSILGKQHRFE